jgi:inhibitor of KinA sporulation pathway (predicted exonuclease)
MLKKLNIELEDTHHSGIDDCKNLAKIVIKMVEKKYTFNIK